MSSGKITVLWSGPSGVDISITPGAFTVAGSPASFPVTITTTTTFVAVDEGEYTVTASYRGQEVANHTLWLSSGGAYVFNAELDDAELLDAIDLAASSGMDAANNLSDVVSASSARTNLGLGNVDNTTDANKPVSTAQATAIGLKLTAASNLSDVANAGTVRTNLSLGNVTNTSDANKPVSTAQQTALNAKVAKSELFLNVKDYGATGDGTTNDTTAIQNAINDAQTGGRPLLFPAGTYVVTGGLTSTVGIRWVGESYRLTIVQSAATDVLTVSGYGHTFENIHFKGRPGGGHAVVVPPGGVLSQSQFSMCQLTSQNDAKSTFKYTSVGSTGGGIFDVHWLDCYFLHLSTSTVPGFDVYGDNNVFSANKFTRCRAQLCGTAAFFYIAADGAAGEANYNNVWDTINFESTNGGGIKAMSATDWGIYNPGFFDMGTITGDLISFGRLSGSPVRPQSRGMNIYNYHRSGGTLSSVKDINLIAGGCTGTANMYGVGGPNAAGILVDLGSAVGYAAVIGYDPTNVGIQNATNSTTLITGQLGIQTGLVTFKPATGGLLPTFGAVVGTPEAVVTAAIGSTRARVDGVNGTILYVKTSGSGNTGWVPLRGVVPSTTAALAAIGNAINTTGKGTGDMVFNTTTSKPVWSTGTTAGSVWVDATGATAHTPV